jgi:hypothetical protein
MAFVLDTRLWGGLPLLRGGAAKSPMDLTLAVTYLDGGGGSFDISFDSSADKTCAVPKRRIHVSLSHGIVVQFAMMRAAASS